MTRRRRAFQPLRGNTVGALELSIVRFRARLRRAARRIAGRDRDLAEDLYQVAITLLWEIDPARFDEEEDAYLWQSMINQMRKAVRGNATDPTRPPLALRFP